MDLKEKRAREKGQTPEGNTLRGGATGFIGGYASPVAGVMNGRDYAKAGKTYRKRDGLRDGAVGMGGAVAGALAGGAAGAYGASRLVKNRDSAVRAAKIAAIAGGLGGGYAASRVSGKAALRRRQQEDSPKNFSTMTSTTQTLVQFSANLDRKLAQSGLVEFARDPRQEDKPSMLKRAAVVGGAGALAAGGLYARGRLARNGGKWGSTKAPGRFASDTSGPTVGQTIWSDLKRGTGMTKNDVTGAASKVGDLWRNRKTARGAVERMGNVRQLTNVTPA